MTFSKAELQPKTGWPEARADRSDDAELSRRSAAILGIYVANPVHRGPFEAMDRLRAQTAGRRGTRQYAIRVTGSSGAGKSTLAKKFVEKVTARGHHANGERPAVYVELEQACTVKRMWSSILHAYHDGFADEGSVESLRKRAVDAILRSGTSLLLVDEVQHLFYRSKDGLAATDAFKRLLDAGVTSLALLGNEEGRGLLESNVQLVNRMVTPADIRRLDPASDADLDLLGEFLKRFDAAMVAAKLHDRPAGLHDPRLVDILMEVGGGIIGAMINVIREASDHAHLRAAERIEPFDLARAIDGWSDGQNRRAGNPFRRA